MVIKAAAVNSNNKKPFVKNFVPGANSLAKDDDPYPDIDSNIHNNYSQNYNTGSSNQTNNSNHYIGNL